jgi:sugar phosphate isomerase/epimerase
MISAFGDEIAPQLDVQLDVLEQLGIRNLDLRSVDNINIIDHSDAEIDRIEAAVTDRGFRVPVIGSPVGKVDVTGGTERSATREETGNDVGSFAEKLERLDRSIETANRFDAEYVRIFSYYPPDGADPGSYRDEITRRTRQAVDRAEAASITLLHENVPGIYGNSPTLLRELLTTIDSPNFRVIFDAANFYMFGTNPYPEALLELVEYVECFHVKDARRLANGDVEMVPLGEGDIEIGAIIRALENREFDGWLSLEPHLSLDDPSNGLSGREAFVREAHTFAALLD